MNDKMKKIDIEEEPEEKAEAVPESAKEKKKVKSDSDKKLKAEIENLKKELESEKEKLKESEDKYLRLAAEYDNFRKRSKAERDGVWADATAAAIGELFPVIDNLERATDYTAPDKVAEGVKLILSSLPAVYEKLKLVPYGEVGDKFDPAIHNAVMHTDDDAFGENEITDVFQKGYKLGDKVIRYAMVKVAN